VPNPLKYRELLKRLKKFGVVEIRNRGKGSERILLLPKTHGSKKGAQYPIRCHGGGDSISVPVIKAALRRFGIEPDDFW